MRQRVFSQGNAGIAQLVEQLICNQQVVGSNPTAGSFQFSIRSTPFHLAHDKFSDCGLIRPRQFRPGGSFPHDAEKCSRAFFRVTGRVDVAWPWQIDIVSYFTSASASAAWRRPNHRLSTHQNVTRGTAAHEMPVKPSPSQRNAGYDQAPI